MYGSILSITLRKQIGKSLFDAEGAKVVSRIMTKAKALKVPIHLPSDFVIGDKFDKNAAWKNASVETGIPDGWMVSKSKRMPDINGKGMDIGTNSVIFFSQVLLTAKTILWNG